jgi:short-subunit dehydrogenase
MSLSSILIVGATSAIAEQTALALVGRCKRFVLAARNHERLLGVAGRLRARGATVYTFAYDAERMHDVDLLAQARQVLGGELPDAVLIAHAVLPRHEEVVLDPNMAHRTLEINTVSVLTLCTAVCRHFEERGSGVLAVISSVAADRGRVNNFLYAASKAALDVYLDGVRLRWKLRSSRLRVLIIKPGYVRTPMTAHLERMLFPASPERVGAAIARLIAGRRDGRRYIPWWWRPIMAIARLLPDRVMLSIKQ